jgi:hypothetical protein
MKRRGWRWRPKCGGSGQLGSGSGQLGGGGGSLARARCWRRRQRGSGVGSGDVVGGIRRLPVETMAMADQAPQATLNGVGKLQKNGMVVRYGIVAEVTARVLPSGIPDPEQINLALE